MDLNGKVVRLAPLVLALLAACSSDGADPLPAACREPAAPLRAGLAQAPERVTLDGIPISGCLVKSSESTDIQRVGADYVAVAVELADAAADEPEGGEALRLGYLVGAVRRGSERTQGIHTELLRRIEQEAEPVARRSRAYARGERAGHRVG